MNAHPLAALNPQLSKGNDGVTDVILCDDEKRVRGSQLSSYLAIKVPQLLALPIDKRLFSYELEQALDTPELKKEFNCGAHNLLQVCDFSSLPSKQNALDLTQDFGGTAGHLAQHFDAVDAIKLDIGAAQFSAQRCQDLTNIEHVSADIDRLELPANYYDIIYAGDTESLNLSATATSKLITKLRASLSDSGVMVFSLKNKDRLSKSLSVHWPKTESTVPYDDLYKGECTSLFNLADLDSIASAFEFNNANIFASYSASPRVSNLFARAYLENSDSALNHFYRVGSIRNPNLNEYLLYKALKRQGKNLFAFASRFILIASNNSATSGAFYNNDFTHFAGTGRLPQWRTITAKKSRSDTVTKTHVNLEFNKKASDLMNSDKTPLLSQTIAKQQFQPGPLLVDQWLCALLRSDDGGFTELVRQYHQWLITVESRGEFNKQAYDLLPFNVVCSTNDSRSYCIIDPEWQISADITPDFVLFRALFWLAFENRALLSGFATHYGFKNIENFVQHYLNAVSKDALIDDFIELEEQAQSEISSTFNAKSITMAMHQDFSASKINTHSKPLCQVTWADENNHFEQAQAVCIEWSPSSEAQELRAPIKLTDPSKEWLRVDPIDNAGLFNFEAIVLVDQNDNVLWQLSSFQEIAEAATLVNVVISDRSNTQRHTPAHNFIALNEDPYLLFNLSGVGNLSSVAEVRVRLSLCFEPNYHNALNELRDIVAKQKTSLTELSNKGHETRADIDLLTHKLHDANNDRVHLHAQLNELKTLRKHNHELEAALMRSPSARIKRAIQRLLGLVDRQDND